MQCICGNHDREAIENGSFEEQTLAYLRQLPATLNFTWETRRVALAHGAPWSDLVYLYPTSERHVFKRVAREACAEIVILGHTHVPLVAQVGDTWICNPGSVCEQEFEGSQTCGVLTVPDFSFDVYQIASQERVEMRPVHITR
jgi:putative phosphoesterase